MYCYPEKENIFLKSSVKDVSLFSKDVIPSSKDVTLPSKDIKLNGSTVLTDLYDTTKDIKQAQTAAGHTTAAMTLKHYIKGRHQHTNTATPIASVYGLEN